MTYPGTIKNRGGELYLDGVSVIELAEKFGTPLYVVSETRIRQNYKNILSALTRNYKKIKIFYSAKANTNLSVLKILESEGANIDAVSTGEVFSVFQAGFPSERILYTGTSVSDYELRFLIDSNVMINVDSISQLNRLLKMATPDLLSVRINPGIGAGHHEHVITASRDSKFGLWKDDAVKAYRIAEAMGIRRFGVQMHVGSGILEIKPLIQATKELLTIVKTVHDLIDIDFEFIDIGGGLGVPYKPEEKELDLNLFSNEILSLFQDKIKEYDLGEPYFCMQPGRYVVCDAGILLTAINTVKVTPYKKFVGVDAGFNTLLRPAMYGSYHHILVANKLNLRAVGKCDVVGPICETGDVLAKNRNLPDVHEGDLLAILNTGAYGYSMSSQYNMRPRPAEILVKKGKYELIRKRETIQDLIAGQKVAAWLN